MAWTTPRTWVTDEVVRAAMFNAYRDNLFESETAKLLTAGDLPYAIGPNALGPHAIGSSGKMLESSGSGPAWAPDGNYLYWRSGTEASWTNGEKIDFFTGVPAEGTWFFRGALVFTSVSFGSGTDATWTLPGVTWLSWLRIHADGTIASGFATSPSSIAIIYRFIDSGGSTSSFHWYFAFLTSDPAYFIGGNRGLMQGAGNSATANPNNSGWMEGFRVA